MHRKLVMLMNNGNRNIFFSKKIILSILLVVLFISLGYWKIYRDRRCHKLIIEMDCVANILLLFAEDNGHMPSNFDELMSKGYLKKIDENNYKVG